METKMDEPLKEHELLEKFRVLYKKYAPALIFYAARVVDATTAEDLVHDVFLKVWNKRALIFWEEGLQTYLYNAVRHACLDHLKHQEVKNHFDNNIMVKLKIEELYYSETSAYPWQEDSRLQSIYKEIDALPERCREIFVMAYIEERKTSDIASLLNISKRTVEAQLYKGLKQIKKALRVFV
ncbi:MAG: RNA polymerase sigma-70 factor [Tannerellaceae bacterium]|jgi:RNA polymerase sigma-70 factor (ECF subfamily)|nr:RNA polymerase sigma-70 factor [Tannerellaceae bacterium]